jgi:hypothetical protein
MPAGGIKPWSTSDIGDFDLADTDEAKIGREVWVPCRLCRQIFLRLRLTARYCGTCKRGFCEGEHGSFTGRGPAVCVRCYRREQSKSELLQT